MNQRLHQREAKIILDCSHLGSLNKALFYQVKEGGEKKRTATSFVFQPHCKSIIPQLAGIRTAQAFKLSSSLIRFTFFFIFAVGFHPFEITTVQGYFILCVCMCMCGVSKARRKSFLSLAIVRSPVCVLLGLLKTRFCWSGNFEAAYHLVMRTPEN